MKLSEAIRQGATLKPQAVGHLYIKTNGQERTCALGAAYDATFGFKKIYNGSVNYYTQLREAYPCLGREDISFDDVEFQDYYKTLEQKIVRMNDKNKLTREQIADRLEVLGL